MTEILIVFAILFVGKNQRQPRRYGVSANSSINIRNEN